MAVVAKFAIPQLTVAITDGLIRVCNDVITNDELGLVKVGRIDVPISGEVEYPLAGYGVSLGDKINVNIKNYNGSNHATSGVSDIMTIVVDDGVAPPSILKYMAIGDSFTDMGSSGTTTGDRPANENVGLYGKGFWVASAYMYASSDYIFRTDMGQSGTTTGVVLGRINDITARDVDFVTILLGTNDVGESGAGGAQAELNYTDIVNALLIANINVLIVPVTRRNDFTDPAAANLAIDSLNAHCASLAALNDGVEIVPVNTAFNAAILSNKTDYGNVSYDGLHPTDTGSMILASGIAPVMDALFPSTIANKVSIAPAEFTGTGGTLSYGATGTVPDNYQVWYPNNTTEDGVQYVDRGDGKQWLKIRTNGGTPVSNNHRCRLIQDNAACTAGWWVGEITVEVKSPEVMNQLRLAINSGGSTYSYTDNVVISTTEPNTGMDSNTQFKIRTPTARFEDDTGYMYFETIQNEGVDAVIYVTDVKLYKVEEL